MPEPLTRYEDRTANVKTKAVVLKRRPMPFAHQEPDQAFIGFVHDLLATGEADPRSVDNGEIVGHHAVQTDEAVIEDGFVVPRKLGDLSEDSHRLRDVRGAVG